MGAKKAIKSFMAVDPDVKAIACSGYSNDPVMANFEDYGFRNAITKPYKVGALSEVLSKVIGNPKEAYASAISSSNQQRR